MEETLLPGAPTHLRCEALDNPLGIGKATPCLGWWLTDPRPGARQSAYQIEAYSSSDTSGEPDLWDSGKVESDDNGYAPWDGPALPSRQRVYWRVRTWDTFGKPSPYSQLARFETGLLHDGDWQGAWIGVDKPSLEKNGPAPYFRAPAFELREAPAKARLYWSALGYCDFYINGQLTSDAVLQPGWTCYQFFGLSLVHDVTALLQAGTNALGAMLGDGWFSGRIGWQNSRNRWGERNLLRAQLELTYKDGSREVFRSDADWCSHDSPVTMGDIYDGEDYDARKEMPGWCQASQDLAAWQPVIVETERKTPLMPKPAPLVRTTEQIPAQTLTEPAPGHWVFDFGQNVVGVPRMALHGEPGQTLTFRFAEMLEKDGTLYTANYRSARSTNTYTFKDCEPVTWHPRFTFHGFRYVEITGLQHAPSLEALTALVWHNDMEPTGEFACSHADLNQLQSNIRWGQRGNYLEAPTDCPQRDERLGWTGDAQVFIRTASFNYDIRAFFEQWLAVMRKDQQPTGAIPPVLPWVGFGEIAGGQSGWGDAATVCPWVLYEQYGDVRVLEKNYDTMRKWVAFFENEAKDFIVETWTFGDWLDPYATDPGLCRCPKHLINTAYFAWSTELTRRAAEVLGKTSEAAALKALHGKIIDAFNREFVTPAGRLAGDCQTAYLLALGFDLLPEEKRPYAVKRLVDEVHGHRKGLATGFLGTPLLLPVLQRFGQTDLAYHILLREEFPGWLFTIRQGATTMWERWGSYSHEKGFGDAGMNSFNHYAYGCVGEWMYANIGGLRPDPAKPGARGFIVSPRPHAAISHGKVRLDTPIGRAHCQWELKDGDALEIDLQVPANASARLDLERTKASALEVDGKAFDGDTLPAGSYAVRLSHAKVYRPEA